MKRIVTRTLPGGILARVQPFHVSLKGLENAVLCRDDHDYDTLVKYIAICARRKKVIVIIYAVVSNHCHEAVLARSQAEADAFGEELKRVYSMWFSRKYREERILQKVDAKAIALDNDWYVRNALAYIPNNSLDNRCPVHEYRWSAFRAMFRHHQEMWKPGIKPVALLNKREREAIMHTGDQLKDVPWKLDEDNMLAPESFCDTEYLEQVFNNDQAFWLKTIGTLNPAEMEETLINAPRALLPDSELFKEVADISRRWFSTEIGLLPIEKKLRLLPFVWRSRKTTVNQLARVLGLERRSVKEAVKAKSPQALQPSGQA
jgi:REP element-mobilizing transposase RayT